MYRARRAAGAGRLQLAQRPGTRIYDARLTSLNSNDLGRSDGIGTLGNLHLILDFDRGTTADFYFEGNVQASGDVITGIAGQFVFADQRETLPVSFTVY